MDSALSNQYATQTKALAIAISGGLAECFFVGIRGVFGLQQSAIEGANDFKMFAKVRCSNGSQGRESGPAYLLETELKIHAPARLTVTGSVNEGYVLCLNPKLTRLMYPLFCAEW